MTKFFLAPLLAISVVFAVDANSTESASDSVGRPAVQEDKATEKTDWWGASWDKTSRDLLFSGALATTVTASMDHPLRDQWKNHQLMSPETSRVGDLLGTGIPGATIALAQLLWDRPNGVSHAKSLVAAALWTGTSKLLTNRKRPGDLRHYNAFPSGHTSTMFTTATSLTYSYGWKVGVPAYLLATVTGLSRMADDVHWASDVVAGAFVGVWMGRAYHESVKAEISQGSTSKTESSLLIIPTVRSDACFVQVLFDY